MLVSNIFEHNIKTGNRKCYYNKQKQLTVAW